MLALAFTFLSAHADLIPMPNESLQLQRLIEQSQQQIAEAKKLVENSKSDVKANERATQLLEQLSTGLDRSIQAFKGTRVYEQALLEVQKQNAAERAKPQSREREKKTSENLDRFQSESLRANQNDLADQEKLEQALATAEPGFLPKIQTRVQLGSWQANTRTSTQLSELITAVRELREEMRGGGRSEGLETLFKSTEAMSQRLRGVDNGPK